MPPTIVVAVKVTAMPVVRTAVEKSMRVLGGQFVQGRDMAEASRRSAPTEAKGWRYSYDMLGEAARTAADATRYFQSYGNAISSLSERCSSDDCHFNPGISVKLSALNPRYEYSQRDRVMAELVPRLIAITGNNPDVRIFIRGDQAIYYGRVMDVMGRINAAGYRKVALVTRHQQVKKRKNKDAK